MLRETAPPGGARRVLPYLLAPFASLYATGCILEDNKCGPHQVEHRGLTIICVCEPNAVASPDGHTCEPCGENEQASSDQCVCMPGFARATEGGPCEESAIGSACASDAACAEPYSHCVSGTDGAGYCSGECEGSASCPGGWSCEPEDAVRVCKKLPTGLGASCQTNADCAGYDATYCEAFRSRTCQLQDCASGATVCPSEWGCCDFSALIGVSMCMAPEALVDGACPGGAKLVKP